MTNPKTRMPTAAERLAARVLGEEIPETVEVPASTSVQRLLDRAGARSRPVKPKGTGTAEWYARRALGTDDPDDDEPSAA